MIGDILYIKAVIIKVPKEILKPYLVLFKDCGINITDITLGALGDYYESRNEEFDSDISAIVNIGYDKMDVSIYNKGIMIKYETIDIGSKTIDKDLAYVYKIKRGQARRLKENFALANSKYASIDDTIELVNREGQDIVLNQLEVSEVVEARIIDLLKLAKKQITLLTNREIGNIIITGGISEMDGFASAVEKEFDHRTSVLDIRNMGVRSNMYSSCLGLIKYFYNKLDFRGITYSMVKDEDSNKFSNRDRNRDSILNKVFGYFRDE
jgi:cell division protein FtsA